MFPIPWNFPFRKKDGSLSTISAEMGGTLTPATANKLGGVKVGSGLSVTSDGTLSGTNELPEYTIATAGKVLTVGDDGSLEWDEKGAGGGDTFLIYDFTKWGNRDIYDVLFSENGAVVKTRNGRIRIYDGLTAFNNFTLYIDTGDLHIDSAYGNHQRFVMGSTTNGLIYEKTNHVWGIWNGNSWEYSEISDADFFDNCTIKVYVDTNNVWHIYKNGVLAIEGVTGFSSSTFIIGASEYSIKDAVFYGARLYNGNYTET